LNGLLPERHWQYLKETNGEGFHEEHLKEETPFQQTEGERRKEKNHVAINFFFFFFSLKGKGNKPRIS